MVCERHSYTIWHSNRAAGAIDVVGDIMGEKSFDAVFSVESITVCFLVHFSGCNTMFLITKIGGGRPQEGVLPSQTHIEARRKGVSHESISQEQVGNIRT